MDLGAFLDATGVSLVEEVEALRRVVEGTVRATGEEFFRSLVEHLAGAMRVNWAFVAEFCGEGRVRTRAFWARDKFIGPEEWDVAGTPCEDVVKGKLCHYPMGVAGRFPADKPLTELGVQSYLGVPLVAADGMHLGHLAVFDARPMPEEARELFIFHLFAARAAAEFERLRTEQRLLESERQFRDLYEEAPIAYVHEDSASKFYSANRAAMRLLGLKAEEVEGTYGLSLCAPTPENKAAIEKAFKLVGTGREQTLPVLELRRKDNGKPLWVRWWSKPDPDGNLTRTMFIDITEQVLMEREKNRLQAQNLYLQEEIKAAHNFEEIVGRSKALLKPLELVRQVAGTDSSVLILGETGTGKELIARAIHNAGARRNKPLIKINCAALPSGLVESELFGHEKGAFSGAIARRVGRFELAEGGTIFLDEIGEMPLEAQVKLLRVLQEREFERVGGTGPIKVDVRLIAATNRDLRKAIGEGRFREDLFYRLNVFPVQLPALRERAEDIPLLVNFLLGKFAGKIGKRFDGVSAETMRRLQAYGWPGNVRELENVIERAVILAVAHGEGAMLEVEAELLPEGTVKAMEMPASPGGDLKSVEREHILAMLGKTNWVIEGERGAAKLLDLHPNTLRSRMKKLGIERG